jgi:hypothetical protein
MQAKSLSAHSPANLMPRRSMNVEVPVELLTLLEQGIAKLSPRDRQFLLARIEGLTFAEIGRRCGVTRPRVHQVIANALEALRKSYGPRIPRLLETLKRLCLSIPNSSGLTPALLQELIGDSPQSFRLPREAQVRLIAALDKNIPSSVRRGKNKRDLDLASVAGALRLATAPDIPRNFDASLREPAYLTGDR